MIKNLMAPFAGVLFAMSLASCGLSIQTPDQSVAERIVGQYATVSVLLTQTSQVAQAQTPTPPMGIAIFSPSQPASASTDTPIVHNQSTTITRTGEMAVPCNQARAGLPIDVTIPDESHMRPGEYFSKTWRLFNAGSCSWDRGYAVVWFSGDDLGVTRALGFNAIVAPGQSVDVTVDMQAPKTAGTYQSNWKLRSSQGDLFGIGPGSSAPFWVRVVVVALYTDTPSPTAVPATPTLRPEVFSSGILDLAHDIGLDLDSGETSQIVNDDLRMARTSTGQMQLIPKNGARLVVYGQNAPEFTDCTNMELDTTPLLMDDLVQQAYLCFRTTEGLPGWMNISVSDSKPDLVTIEFVTWVIP